VTNPRLLGCSVVARGSTWWCCGAIAHRHLSPEGIALGRFAIASSAFAAVALCGGRRRAPDEWRVALG
jgi:hypothetical protein